MIASTANEQVKRLIRLEKKAKERNAEGVFTAEGVNLYQEAPPDQIVQIYVSETFYQKREALFGGKEKQVTVLSDRVFESVSDTRTPQGVLLVMRQSHYSLPDLMGHGPQAPFLIVLENLQDPGNLGTIMRSAEAAGATGILLTADCADLYNPKTVRATMGAIFRVPFFHSEDLMRDMRFFRERGVCFYAAHLAGEVSYDEQDYCGPCGFLIGNEGQGLTEETAAFADSLIRIPMCGQAESLNAASAAAVLMYEVNRQRRKGAREIE